MKHDSKALEVFLVCFCGAFIGTLVAIWAGVFWPIGLLVGAAIGYFGINYREVPTAFVDTCLYIIERFDDHGCNRRDAKLWFKRFINGFESGFTFISWFTLAIGWAIAPTLLEHDQLLLLLALLLSLFVVGILAVALANSLDDPPKVKWPLRFSIFALIYWPLVAIVLGCKHRKAIKLFFKTFFKTFFRIIHSGERTICAVYAAFGVLVWFVLGQLGYPVLISMLSGASAGGILGFLAFKLIFPRICAKTAS